MNPRRLFLQVGLSAAALKALAACTENFNVQLINHRDVAIKVGVGQFHAPDFKTTPPQTFTERELIKQDIFELAPGEQRTVVYSSSSGGFWLQWRLLDPLLEPNRLFRMDLLRDERTINVR